MSCPDSAASHWKFTALHFKAEPAACDRKHWSCCEVKNTTNLMVWSSSSDTQHRGDFACWGLGWRGGGRSSLQHRLVSFWDAAAAATGVPLKLWKWNEASFLWGRRNIEGVRQEAAAAVCLTCRWAHFQERSAWVTRCFYCRVQVSMQTHPPNHILRELVRTNGEIGRLLRLCVVGGPEGVDVCYLLFVLSLSPLSLRRLAVPCRARSHLCNDAAPDWSLRARIRPWTSIPPIHHPQAQQWFELPVSCQPAISQRGSDWSLFLCQTVRNEARGNENKIEAFLNPTMGTFASLYNNTVQKKLNAVHCTYIHN